MKKKNWLMAACGAAAVAVTGMGIYDIQMDHVTQGQTLLGFVVPIVGYMFGIGAGKSDKGGKANGD